MRDPRRISALAAAAALAIGALTAAPAVAELKAGSPAPVFSTQATLGEKVFTFDLAAALKSGPVVLYFYPAAFTTGCTVEAHDFAEHIGDYKKLRATVIGVSGDDIAKLKQFSVSECRSKFPVAADENLKIASSYDAKLGFGPVAYANRTSYVIAPDGKIVYSYTSLDPEKHVANTLAALRKIAAQP
jgi:peroxiredoxin (alkyl hydroperoxide reductase subunit C)